MNYFEVFGLPISFRIDEDELRRRFYDNSKRYHPDFHTLADQALQAEMLERSTLNNEAFQTLRDPNRRIHYLLKLFGLLAEEGEQEKMPQDFLLEVMEINEQLMELEFEFDASQYERVKALVQNLEDGLDQKIQPVLNSWTPEQEKILEQVRDFYFKKRYLLRIKENMSKFAPASEKRGG